MSLCLCENCHLCGQDAVYMTGELTKNLTIHARLWDPLQQQPTPLAYLLQNYRTYIAQEGVATQQKVEDAESSLRAAYKLIQDLSREVNRLHEDTALLTQRAESAEQETNETLHLMNAVWNIAQESDNGRRQAGVADIKARAMRAQQAGACQHS